MHHYLLSLFISCLVLDDRSSSPFIGDNELSHGAAASLKLPVVRRTRPSSGRGSTKPSDTSGNKLTWIKKAQCHLTNSLVTRDTCLHVTGQQLPSWGYSLPCCQPGLLHCHGKMPHALCSPSSQGGVESIQPFLWFGPDGRLPKPSALGMRLGARRLGSHQTGTQETLALH